MFAENGAISTDAGVTVAINILRLDADGAGTVVLIAQYESRGMSTVTRNLRLTATPTTSDTAGLVAAMSTVVGQMADAIATSLPPPRH